MQSTASISGLPVSRAMRVESSRSSARILRGHGAQIGRLLDAGHPPPGGLGSGRGLDGGGNVVGSAVGDDAEEVERGGVPDLAGGTGAGGNPGAVDQDGGDVGHAVVLGKDAGGSGRSGRTAPI